MHSALPIVIECDVIWSVIFGLPWSCSPVQSANENKIVLVWLEHFEWFGNHFLKAIGTTGLLPQRKAKAATVQCLAPMETVYVYIDIEKYTYTHDSMLIFISKICRKIATTEEEAAAEQVILDRSRGCWS